ncbi:MAG: DUF2062 domain-containing protein [Halofilum sp. (in: g-proteobacteria)]|nr:DUF2062 domain-containing protein [Halofilum sp. (in: g-proteobacteria)]
MLVWVSNPLTMGPMYWFGWWLGASILGREHVRQRFEFTFDWFTTELAQIWQPLFLGCIILAFASAGAGLLVARLSWRYHVIRTLLERRRARKARKAASQGRSG